MTPPTDLRPLGDTGIMISSVAFGAWPIAGVSSLEVNDADSLGTIRASLDAGINFLDTAYIYGKQGESEKLIHKVLRERGRDGVVIATKGGIHYDAAGKQTQDARPETLIRECDESLKRLGVDEVELYYLHAPDPHVPIAESAGTINRFVESGKALSAGASNCSLAQLKEFHAVCPLAAVQFPYNMLQRDIEERTVPWCRENNIAATAYWPLMKGLLAGKLTAETTLDERDSRRTYPMYQGEELEKNLAFVEQLRKVADEAGKSVAQVVVNWTIHQPGITSALCGAKRAWQIEETAGAMGWKLSPEQMATIDAAIAARGKAAVKRLFQ